jgi:two-component system, chemotaxis family, sensor kinase CheA
MNALHEQFIVEARELIHQAIDDLITTEREGVANERVERLLRTFHTLKGSAGVVELPAMSLTLHAAEDVLAAIHVGRLDTTATIIDQALACLDLVSRWVDEFEAHRSLPLRADDDARVMTRQLRNLLLNSAPTQQIASERKASASVGDEASPEWVLRLIQSERAQNFLRAQARSIELVAISYEPHVGCFFNGDDPIALMRKVPQLLAFHIEAREAWAPLAELDPFVCLLRFQGISAGNRTELSHIFRLVPDQVRIVDVPLERFGLRQSTGIDEIDRAALIRAVIAEQRLIVDFTDRSEDFTGRIGAAARVAANAMRYHLRIDLAEQIERAGATATRERNVEPLLSILDDTIELIAPIAPHTEEEKAKTGGPSSGRTEIERAAEHWVRVEESRIDTLVNLAGELLVVKNSFAHLATRIERPIETGEVAQAIGREREAIERLATEMHAAILQLRMVPLAQVFRSFPRLVRDMSQRFNKKVRLLTLGETTESDKAIVDRLFEPLMHLVRNALDHGIESPEERRAAGKPESSTITMQASRLGDRLVVEVIDDGRGIDPEIIRRRARVRGLLTIEELADQSDDQIIDLVFSAGFSTATEVSDVSGRGVGMDVVRATAEQIGGWVSLASRVGAGTTVRLDLPISIAMSRIMVAEAGGQVFGIPMEGVTETLHLSPDRIAQIKSNDAFVLRDRILPICSLAELMNLPEEPGRKSDARLVIITETSGRMVALEVDAIRDRLDVVLKPMQGLLANARGYLGTTLLGDGRVLLVLDLKELLP